MTARFWTWAIITTISALVSAGFSVAGLFGPSGSDIFERYATSRSIALLISVLCCIGFRSPMGIAALALVMTLVQGFDGLIGALAHDPASTHGPFALALANLAALVWLLRSFVNELTLKPALAAIILLLSVAAPAVAAGPFEDASAAYWRDDYPTALRQFRPLADEGDARAQTMLGLMYTFGQGVPKDYAEAVKWYRLAANQGDAEAQGLLGSMYDDGLGVPRSHAEAAKWYRLEANQGGASAQKTLGSIYYSGHGVPQNYAEAAKWYRLAANQGDVGAQTELGAMYYSGLGVPKNYAEAARWYRKAADRGWRYAQTDLGIMYYTGQGVPQNYTEAARWYRKAADQNYSVAQNELGVMYERGQGVPQNYTEAVKWYREAAEQGNAHAQLNLGYKYYTGQGLPQNYVQAHTWFNLAASSYDSAHQKEGRDQALKYRDVVAAKMTPAQIAEAQKLAREWRPEIANASSPQAAPQPPAPEKPESGAISGTAFFVSEEGTALTNSHVVERCRQIRVHSGAQNGAARVMARDDENDLALLATDLQPASAANWRLSIRQGEDIIVFGFPLAGVLATGGNVAVGNVTALAGLGNDSRFLQISAPVQPGNSGGPLLDRNGNVVGIVVAKLDALGIASVTGDIPQNVNFAIKASVAAAFLDAQRVVHADGRASSPALSTPDIAERAKGLTMQVVCLR
jgi:TPR repeat protein